MELPVRITKYFGDDPQPGVVECEFEDVDGRTHTIVDKVYTFIDRLLSEQEPYPLPGTVQCEVLLNGKAQTGGSSFGFVVWNPPATSQSLSY